MGIVASVKNGFALASRSLPLVLVLFVFNLVWNLGSIPFGSTPPEQWGGGLWGFATLFTVAFLLLSVFVQGGVIGFVKEGLKDESEEVLELAPFWEYGKSFYLRLLGVSAVLVVAAGLVSAIFIVAGALALGVMVALEGNILISILSGGAALAVTGLALYFLLLLFYSPYVLVVEDTGIIDSLKASFSFTRPIVMKVIGLLLLLLLVSVAAVLVITLAALILSAIRIPDGGVDFVMRFISSGVNGYLGVVSAAALMSYFLGSKSGGSAPVTATATPASTTARGSGQV